MNSKLVDSLAQIISSLTHEEQLDLKLKLSDYSILKIVSNNVSETKNEFPPNPLEKMQPYAFLANPSEPVIPEDDWIFNHPEK